MPYVLSFLILLSPLTTWGASISFTYDPLYYRATVTSVQVDPSEFRKDPGGWVNGHYGWLGTVKRNDTIVCTSQIGPTQCHGAPSPRGCFSPEEAAASVRQLVGAVFSTQRDPSALSYITSALFCGNHNPGDPKWAVYGVVVTGKPPVPVSCSSRSIEINIHGATGETGLSGRSSVEVQCSAESSVRLTVPRGGSVDLAGGASSIVSFESGGATVTIRANPSADVPVTASVVGVIDGAGVYHGSTAMILEII